MNKIKACSTFVLVEYPISHGNVFHITEVKLGVNIIHIDCIVGGRVRQALCQLQTFDNFLIQPKMLSGIF